MHARRWLIAGGSLAVLAVGLGVAGAQYGSTLPEVASTGPRNFANPTYSALIVAGIVVWVIAMTILHRAWGALFGASSTAWWAAVALGSAPVALWGALALMSFADGWFVILAGVLLVLTPVSLAVGLTASTVLVITRRRAAA